ncbi:MAG: hypothetical protein GY937_17585 [bacterium]|nr:hypothetical protein [bacterium]
MKQILVLLVLLQLSVPAGAETTTGTLTLDSLSFISFEGYENLNLPAGSTIEFAFSDPDPGGSVSFTILPSGVSIPSIQLWSTPGELRYTLAAPATGTATKTSEGIKISFSATVSVTLVQQGGGTFQYSLPFTTESASATNAAGTNTVSLSGMQLVEGPNHVQLVGATTNKTNAFPEPGRAVSSVLSGTFDTFPTFP